MAAIKIINVIPLNVMLLFFISLNIPEAITLAPHIAPISKKNSIRPFSTPNLNISGRPIEEARKDKQINIDISTKYSFILKIWLEVIRMTCAIEVDIITRICAKRPIKYLEETISAALYGNVPQYTFHLLRSSYPSKVIGIMPAIIHG